LKLAATLCQAGAAINEDMIGWVGEPDDIRAAWVLDGVTGINGHNILGQPTDAAWFASRIDARLRGLMGRQLLAREIVARLVEGLREDQAAALAGARLPENYETPAACIACVHRIDGTWHGFRLGDCRLMAVSEDGQSIVVKESGLEELETGLKVKAVLLREQGIADPYELRRRLDPDQRALRARRNTRGGYGVIVADPVCLDFIEARPLGQPRAVLLCSDGLYRAVDHYGLHDDRSLLTEWVDRPLCRTAPD
jgi:serine/threonine protein phosphatase PrpC